MDIQFDQQHELIQQLAMLRAKEQLGDRLEVRIKELKGRNTLNVDNLLTWSETPEKTTFWSDVYHGPPTEEHLNIARKALNIPIPGPIPQIFN